MTLQRALAWSIFWILLSLMVAGGVGHFLGAATAEAFLTGYTLEKALSVDNLFVFLLLFTHFKVDHQAQRRALNYGILGVLVLRGLLIFAGVALVHQFEWLMYVFGVIVVYSGFAMAFGGDKEFDAERSKTLKLVRRFVPVTNEFHGARFFIRNAQGRLTATPLFVVLIVLEVTDIIFAVDSIPAIFAVTRDPLLIYGSNMLAVLGLRSLYFLLAKVQESFRFVKQGVGGILWFVGLKMLLPLVAPSWHVSNALSLTVVLGLLLGSILVSLLIPVKHRDTKHHGA